MNAEVIIVLSVIVFIIISFYKNLIGPAFTFFIATVVLGLFGILTPREILNGFSNENVVVIIMLLLLGDIIRQMNLINTLFAKMFKYAKNYKIFLVQMMFFVSLFSTFLNNTPIVAIMLPFVMNWSKKHRVKSSLLLMPLSFAAIIGGTATLIGSSTNLMVNGLVKDQQIISDLPDLGMFDFSPVGGIMIILGIIYFYFFGTTLLNPSTKNKKKKRRKPIITHESKEYYLEIEIRKKSSAAGKPIKDTTLGNAKVKLIEIIRDGKVIENITKQTILEVGDIIHITGEKEEIAEFIMEGRSQFTFPMVGMLMHKTKISVAEIVVSYNSTFINKKLGDIHFRSRFDATPIAIFRNGEKFYGEKIKDIKVQAGDLILLLTGESFYDLASATTDFYSLSIVKEMERYPLYKSLLVLLGLFVAIGLSMIGVVSLFISLSVLFVLIFALKIVSPKDIQYRVDYNLFIIIALSLSLGTAMIKTGTAEYMVQLFDHIFKTSNIIVIMGIIYIITALLAAYITNKASIAIVLPIVLTLALQHGYNPKPFILLVAYAAAANFITPVGYQTNLMIYGPGGYTFKDFFRVGFPLTIIYMIVTLFVLYKIYF